jgi:hypothetical protein
MPDDSLLTFDEQSQLAAHGIAARVDSERLGMDPATIIMIILSVIRMVIQCYQESHPTTPEEAQAELVRLYELNPRRLHFRLSNTVYKHSATRVNMAQAERIADAIIEHALDQQSSGMLCTLMRGPQ